MDRYKTTKRVSLFGIVGNIFLLIIKMTIGVITRSNAMLADAYNSAGDIFSSAMTFVGNKIANKPIDDDHNLGHGKAEYVFSLLISLSMILVALVLLYNSIHSFFMHKEFTFSIWLVIVSLTTILVKAILYLITYNAYKRTNNILILANSKDHINDCVVTTFTLISTSLGYFHISIFDFIVGIGISIWILMTGINIFIESYDVLMDKAISDSTKKKVIKILKSHKEVLGFQHFNSTPVGFKYQISFTIFVDGNLSTFESHAIADHLEKEIDEKIDEVFLTVIHVNPR